MGLQVTGDDARVNESFEHAVYQALKNSRCVGIIQVKLCCEQMDQQAHWLLGPLLQGSTPPEVSKDRIRLLAFGGLDKVIAAFESVEICLDLAARHSLQCPGSRLFLTIAENDTNAVDFLLRADRDFQAPLETLGQPPRI